ncbi:MAG: prephenate dehydrogenase [Limnochordales bacterium]|nr:prephenate dehydrogenase [Limnochordales bacterium]
MVPEDAATSLTPINRVAVIGVGLIGGSFGMALLRRGVAREVSGFDVDARSLDRAVALGAITQAARSLEAAVRGAELVIVAVPVAQVVEVTLQVLQLADPDAVVTDVASVKRPVMEAVAACGRRAQFVGGHPMTGSERPGVDAADPYLFENAIYLLMTAEGENGPAISRLTRWIRAIGALPVTVDPDAHDRMVAAVSHLPHLLAAALVRAADRVNADLPLTLSLAAGGFRDTTRIAAGDPNLWADIMLANAEPLLASAQVLENCWHELLEAVANRDRDQLVRLLSSACEVRRSLPVRHKGYVQPFYELVVELQDRPGAIAQVTSILGEAGINLADIEILRAREGFGGTLRLAVESEAARDEALLLLAARGFTCRQR